MSGTAKHHKLSDEEKDRRRNDAAERLRTAATNLLTSDGWKAALQFVSRANRRNDGKPYSFGNLMLIMSQRPDATTVMTFESWKALGRYPNKGEKGLLICMPAKVGGKSKSTETAILPEPAPGGLRLTNKDPQNRVYYFLKPAVFDVSQTAGDPLPEVPRPKVLDLPLPELEAYWTATCAYLVEQLACTITQEPREAVGGTLGYWRARDSHMWVSPDGPRTQQFAVLLHEGAHALAGHHGRVTRTEYDVQEVVAESTAFLALAHYSIPAEDHSVPYLAPYAKDPEVLIPAIQEALKISSSFTDGIDAKLKLLSATTTDASETAAPHVTAVLADEAARADEVTRVRPAVVTAVVAPQEDVIHV